VRGDTFRREQLKLLLLAAPVWLAAGMLGRVLESYTERSWTVVAALVPLVAVVLVLGWPLIRDRRLVLGGVQIDHDRGLDGHSDADSLTHAVIDALLGAAGLGDIGQKFPASEARWKDADSLELLGAVVADLADAGYRALNVDATIVAEQPRLLPHLDRMRRLLAERLGLPDSCVNVKATRGEGLGSIGRGEGIAAHAVATVGPV